MGPDAAALLPDTAGVLAVVPDVAAILAAACLAWLLYRIEKRHAALNRRIRRYAIPGDERRRKSFPKIPGRLRLDRWSPGWLQDRHGTRVATVVLLTVGAAVWFFTGQWWLAPPVAAVAAAMVVRYRKAVRRRAIRRQFLANFPEAVDGLTRSVVAGISVETALGEMGQYFPEVIRDRFSEMTDQLELGVPFATVMKKLTADMKDMDIPELEFFCTVLVINRQTGGRVSEVLTRLSRSLRERSNASRELEILTSEPRASANVVALIPLGLIGAQAVVNPAGIHFLLNDPTGRMVLAYAIASIVLGLAIIRRMTRFG